MQTARRWSLTSKVWAAYRAMDALQGQAMALETERRRGIELARVEAALARMGDGDYGYCVSCGEEISVKRLELDPAVPTCIDCAAKGEG